MRITYDHREFARLQATGEELGSLKLQMQSLEQDMALLVGAIMKQPAFSHWLLMQDNSSSEMWMTQPGNRNQSSIEGKSDEQLALEYAEAAVHG